MSDSKKIKITKEVEKKPEITFKSKSHPLLASLPSRLKDPANYEKIQRALLDALATPHSHSDLLAWGACPKCAPKLREHAELQYRLGFRSPAQYMAWKKVMHIMTGMMKERESLRKYNSK